MFKKGQLVRTKNRGHLYIVTTDQTYGAYVHVKTPGFMHGTLDARNLTLIGNNYQAKQKCSR